MASIRFGGALPRVVRPRCDLEGLARGCVAGAMSDRSFRGVRGIGSLFTRLRCSLMTIATRGDVRAVGLEKQTILIN